MGVDERRSGGTRLDGKTLIRLSSVSIALFSNGFLSRCCTAKCGILDIIRKIDKVVNFLYV